MSAGWVAVSVRARAMARRRLGRAGVRQLAASTSLEEAVATLAESTYGRDVHPGQSLAAAQRGVVDTVVWNLRVLAGWAPRDGVAVLRALVAPLEAADALDHLRELAGLATAPPSHDLGGLATASARLERAVDPAELRRVLASSPWGDPGEPTLRAVALAVRASAADRIVAAVPEAGAWAGGDTALLVARETLLDGRPLPGPTRALAARVVGPAALAAGSLPAIRAALPTYARWALTGVEEPADLWRAEAAWWGRVERDGVALVHRAPPGRAVLVGAVALLAVDAWRVRAALEHATRGGSERDGSHREDVDAVA